MFFEKNFPGGSRVLVIGQRVPFSAVFCGSFFKLRIHGRWLRFFRLALRGAEETPAGKPQCAESHPQA